MIDLKLIRSGPDCWCKEGSPFTLVNAKTGEAVGQIQGINVDTHLDNLAVVTVRFIQVEFALDEVGDG